MSTVLVASKENTTKPKIKLKNNYMVKRENTKMNSELLFIVVSFEGGNYINFLKIYTQMYKQYLFSGCSQFEKFSKFIPTQNEVLF